MIYAVYTLDLTPAGRVSTRSLALLAAVWNSACVYLSMAHEVESLLSDRLRGGSPGLRLSCTMAERATRDGDAIPSVIAGACMYVQYVPTHMYCAHIPAANSGQVSFR